MEIDITDKDNFEREADRLVQIHPVYFGDAERKVLRDQIAQALRAAYQKGIEEKAGRCKTHGVLRGLLCSVCVVETAHRLGFAEGFASCRESAWQIADNRMHGTDDEVTTAKDIRDTICSLRPSEKTGGAE